MKIALYKNMAAGFQSVYEFSEYRENDEDSVRLSEVVDVDLPLLPQEETTKLQVDAIDAQIIKVEAKAGQDVMHLREQKAELLALPQPEPK